MLRTEGNLRLYGSALSRGMTAFADSLGGHTLGYQARHRPDLTAVLPPGWPADPRGRGVRGQGARGRAQVLALSGNAGTGKTLLLGDTVATARQHGLRVLSGSCTRADRDTELAPLARALGDEVPMRPGAQSATMLYRSIVSFLQGWADDGVLLALDDFHWADPLSNGFVEYLVDRPTDYPLYIVITHRTGRAPRSLVESLSRGERDGKVEWIDLDTLRNHPTAEAASPEAPARPTLAELVAEVPEPSKGEDLTSFYAGQDIDHVRVALGRAVALLSDGEVSILEAASVVDGPFDVGMLAAVAGATEADARQLARRLIELDLIRPAPESSRFGFSHPVLCHLVYQRLDPISRIEVHRRALRLLEQRGSRPQARAVHIERSATTLEPAHSPVLAKAATAVMMSDPNAAARWLALALDALPDQESPDRTDLELSRATALGLSGRLAESRDLLHNTLRHVPRTPAARRVDTVTFCVRMECLLTHYSEAVAIIESELDALRDDSPPEALNLLIYRSIADLLSGGRPSRQWVDRALEMAKGSTDRMARIGVLALDAMCYACDVEIEDAMRSARACASLVDSMLDPEVSGHPMYIALLGWAEVWLGLTADAERHLLRGVAIARSTGNVDSMPILLTSLSSAHRRSGRMDLAYRCAVEAVEIAGAIGGSHLLGFAYTLQALASMWTREPEEALRLAEESIRLIPPGSCEWGCAATVALATAARLNDDPRRAMGLLLNVGGPDLAGLPIMVRPQCFETLTACAIALNDPSAVEWAERAAAATDPLGLAHQDAYMHLARAHVLRSRSEHAEAVKLYDKAAALFETSGMACEQAQALMAAAGCLADSGRREEAGRHLTLANELANRTGAASLSRRIESMRPVAGARDDDETRNVLLPQLTTREREIALMAGTGTRTREIAEQLSLSPRTVEVHLSHIYRKLEIDSKTALAWIISGGG